jgi:hypothetical protein
MFLRAGRDSCTKTGQGWDGESAMDVVQLNGVQLLLVAETGPALSSEADALDLIGLTYGQEIDAIVVPVARLGDDFFDLSTQLAGGFFQKFQNYRMRLIVMGEIGDKSARSGALADFVRETNSVGQHLFVADWAELEQKLKAK